MPHQQHESAWPLCVAAAMAGAIHLALPWVLPLLGSEQGTPSQLVDAGPESMRWSAPPPPSAADIPERPKPSELPDPAALPEPPPPPPQPEEEKPRLGRDDADDPIALAWISYDDFQELIAPQSRTEQPALQQQVDPAPEADIVPDPTPPGANSVAALARAAAPQYSPQAMLQPTPPAPAQHPTRAEVEPAAASAQPGEPAPQVALEVSRPPQQPDKTAEVALASSEGSSSEPGPAAHHSAAQGVADQGQPMEQAAATTDQPVEDGQPVQQQPTDLPPTPPALPTAADAPQPAGELEHELAMEERQQARGPQEQPAPPTQQDEARTAEPDPAGETPVERAEATAQQPDPEGQPTQQQSVQQPEPSPDALQLALAEGPSPTADPGQPGTQLDKTTPADKPVEQAVAVDQSASPPTQATAEVEPSPAQASQAPVQQAGATAQKADPTSAPKSESESDPAQLISREPLRVQPGKVITGKGVEIKTATPRFALSTRMTALPNNPVVKIIFGPEGSVRDAQFIRSTGYADCDGPILSSLYKWKASGSEFEKLKQPLEIEITLLLRPD